MGLADYSGFFVAVVLIVDASCELFVLVGVFVA